MLAKAAWAEGLEEDSKRVTDLGLIRTAIREHVVSHRTHCHLSAANMPPYERELMLKRRGELVALAVRRRDELEFDVAGLRVF